MSFHDLTIDDGSPVAGASYSRRVFVRAAQSGVKSSLGPVLDLSKGGLRVLTKRPLTGSKSLTISCDVGTLQAEIKVVWLRRLRFRRYLLGIEFLGLTPKQSALVNRIMQEHGAGEALDDAA